MVVVVLMTTGRRAKRLASPLVVPADASVETCCWTGEFVSILRPTPGRLPLMTPVSAVVLLTGAAVVELVLLRPPKEFSEMPKDSADRFSSSRNSSSSSSSSVEGVVSSSKKSSAESTLAAVVVVVGVVVLLRPPLNSETILGGSASTALTAVAVVADRVFGLLRIPARAVTGAAVEGPAVAIASVVVPVVVLLRPPKSVATLGVSVD